MDRLLTALIKYRYVALFPLAAIEGPVVALAAGVLIHFGYLTVIPSYIILIFGDIIPDTIYYYIGRYSHRINLVEKYKLKSVFISTNLDFMDRLWRDHGRKTMFLAKLAYGLSIPFLISAGLVNMSLRRFLSYTIWPTLFQYGVLMAVGYYLGKSFEEAVKYIKYGGLLVAFLLVLFVTAYILVLRYARRRIVELEKTEQNSIQQ